MIVTFAADKLHPAGDAQWRFKRIETAQTYRTEKRGKKNLETPAKKVIRDYRTPAWISRRAKKRRKDIPQVPVSSLDTLGFLDLKKRSAHQAPRRKYRGFKSIGDAEQHFPGRKIRPVGPKFQFQTGFHNVTALRSFW
jgi:hypothetical protein